MPAIFALLVSVMGCNKEETQTEEIAVTISTVAVKEFSLSPNDNLISNLDSVFFSIDLKHGVIYNADSLPLGTDITRLVPVITFATETSAAEIVMTGGSVREGTVDYKETQTDSIDFSGTVRLNVTAFDKETKFSYLLKVNVHKQKPDSLMWDDVARIELPSRLLHPAAQKTVESEGKYISLIRENDNTYTLSSTESLMGQQWDKKEVVLGFEPDLSSLTSCGSVLYVLDAAGGLFKSENGETWTSTGENWVSIIGEYSSTLLGIKASSAGLVHASLPETGIAVPVSTDFPLKGRSQLASFTTKWSPLPTVAFTGGTLADGTLSDATWAYDGREWARIDNKPVPAISGASMFYYKSYVGTTEFHTGTPYVTLYLLMGTFADGTPNRNLWMSRDNGVTWLQGPELTDLPEFMPSLTEADSFVEFHTLDSDLSDLWKEESTKSPRWLKPAYEINGYEISWECPYIYLIGGQLSSGTLSNTIWRGVTARLAFTPRF